MKEFCLEIKDLQKHLGEKGAIKGLNLALTRGKKVALLGLNGAGKSSFIRLLVGESKPDIGEIVYLTVNPDRYQNIHPRDPAFKRLLGYQSDTMLAITEMTGREYLSLCGHLKGLSSISIKAKLESIIKRWEIENLLEQKMSALSKGNLQKLAIAQVFMANAKFLFFDEPCQSLDPLEQDRFNQNIKKLSDIDLCVFSTHNVNHALEVADEIILFHQFKTVYHFDCHRQHDYLLVCKTPNSDLCLFATEFELKMGKLCEQVYQIHTSKPERLEQLKKRLKQAQQPIEFCLPEKQAVMPLFRLLASGEITFHSTELHLRGDSK